MTIGLDLSVRDYAREMQERIAQATDGTRFAVPVVARRLFEELSREDPELLDGWLREQGLAALTRAVGNRVRNLRSQARQQVERRSRMSRHGSAAARFGQAVRDFEAGQVTALSAYTALHVVNSRHDRARACDMTGPDHQFVAGKYEGTAVESFLLSAFHSAVADRVGDSITSNVLTQDEYEDLYRSICAANGAYPVGSEEEGRE
jgi:hypothetical protein